MRFEIGKKPTDFTNGVKLLKCHLMESGRFSKIVSIEKRPVTASNSTVDVMF